ncbi:hypothetical protein Catovirus_2_264 [Catovirus CTV1]|uniref:Uncharacterized protein n=1 Tax=Catovirus CTV1 TaxID=1977631 RepID=A0A1V0SC73_9VIRU|nr:hypothetical protein Catovirus_2_264 [Catovirus CTV1]
MNSSYILYKIFNIYFFTFQLKIQNLKNQMSEKNIYIG